MQACGPCSIYLLFAGGVGDELGQQFRCEDLLVQQVDGLLDLRHAHLQVSQQNGCGAKVENDIVMIQGVWGWG